MSMPARGVVVAATAVPVQLGPLLRIAAPFSAS
jgi:hypothetical protein